ncbi:MAG: hypothetical protein GXX98_06570 [Planctomycetes bacterium]|nr:hypothetical protein [Planctomycetota bacterium]
MQSARGVSGAILIATIIVFLAVPSGANLVYSNFGSGIPGGGYGIGTYGPGNYAYASSFSVTGTESYTLDRIELAAALSFGLNQLNVSLMADAAGLPGTVLESFSFTDQMPPHGDPDTVVGVSATNPLLTAGSTYWLAAFAPNDTGAVWWCTSPEVYGSNANSVDGGSWYAETTCMPAFEISGTPVATVVPVPGAMLLTSLGLGMIGWVHRRRAA